MENTPKSGNAALYQIGEGKAQARQEKLERLHELLAPLNQTLREAWYFAKPGQSIEIDLPVSVLEHIYEKEPRDTGSIMHAEHSLKDWPRSQLKSYLVLPNIYLELTIQKPTLLSKLGLIPPEAVKTIGLVPKLHAERRHRKNCLGFRFYLYIEKPPKAKTNPKTKIFT
mgnify:CR=1 FL=1